MNNIKVIVTVLIMLVGSLCFASDNSAIDSKVELKLASYNIRYAGGDRGANSWDNRKQGLVKYVNDLKPDVIGMQEALLLQVKYLLANLDGYAMAGVGRDDGLTAGEFSPIFYNRNKFVLDSCGTFWLSETPEVAGSRSWNAACNRICSWVKLVDIDSSKSFFVFNTHFDHQSELAKDESAKLICSKINEIGKGEPAFLTGDFNSLPDSVPVKYITGKLEQKPAVNLIDSLAAVGSAESLRGTFNSFGRAQNPGRIDYIFCPENVEVKIGAVGPDKVGEQFLSDHNPIWADINL